LGGETKGKRKERKEKDQPLPSIAHVTPSYSLLSVPDPTSRQPTRPRPSARSSSASKVEGRFGRRCPLFRGGQWRFWEGTGGDKKEEGDVQTFNVYPLCMIVRMLKPKVGETSSTFSPSIALQMVVLPALSSPLHVEEHQCTLIEAGRERRQDEQHQHPDLLLLQTGLPNDCEESHVLTGRTEERR
jgi:hypothetical protein